MSSKDMPLGISQFFVENEIRKLRDAGGFDNLPGAGKPIPDLLEPYDENWWIKSLIRREKLNFLPETLQLKLDIYKALEQLPSLQSEDDLRHAVAAINTKIRRMNSTAHAGPVTTMTELDVDK